MCKLFTNKIARLDLKVVVILSVSALFLVFTDNVFRFDQLKEDHERRQSPPAEMSAGTMEDLPSSGQEILCEVSEDSKPVLLDVGQTEKEERGRSTDETSHKNRSKRESRRMRELEQAQFSLELLKVRTTSMGGPLQEDSVLDSSVCQLEDQHSHSARGSPASHGSFELLNADDMDTEPQVTALQEHTLALDVQLQEGLTDSNCHERLSDQVEAPRATFYIASDQSPVREAKFESPSKPYKERRESVSRRPVVVLISMQKESPVEEGKLLAAQTLGAPETETASFDSHITPIAGLEVASEIEQPHEIDVQAKREVFGMEPSLSAHESSPELPGICSSEVDIQIILEPNSQQERKAIQPPQEAPSPVLDTKPPKAQKKSSAQTVIVNMVEKPSNTVFSPPRRKLPFSK